MSALEQGYIMPEQYLELERKAAFKSEYFSGRMFAMSVGSNVHSLIGGNVHALLWSQLRGRPCFTFTSDMQGARQRDGLRDCIKRHPDAPPPPIMGEPEGHCGLFCGFSCSPTIGGFREAFYTVS